MHALTCITLKLNNRAWIKKYPNKIGKQILLKATTGLVHNPQPSMPAGNNHLIIKYLRGGHSERKEILQTNPPTSAMGFDTDNKTITMKPLH